MTAGHAQIVLLKEVFPMEGLDRVNKTFIGGHWVIIGKELRAGDLVVYFAPNTFIAGSFLSWHSLYKNKKWNKDQGASGYFEKDGRVRTITLQGQTSVGFCVSLELLRSWMPFVPETYLIQGTVFRDIEGLSLCWKLEPDEVKRVSRRRVADAQDLDQPELVDGQFRFPITMRPGKCIKDIPFTETVTVTVKSYGASVIVGQLLGKRKLPWYERLAKKLGIPVVETEYVNVCSSPQRIRGVLAPGSYAKGKRGVWWDAYESLEQALIPGLTIYAHALGFNRYNKAIRKGYDYGCLPFTHKVEVYRITYTTPQGHVIEFNDAHMRAYATANKLTCVDLLYRGPLYELEASLGGGSYASPTLLAALKLVWVDDKMEIRCFNKMPREGIVLRVDTQKPVFYKLVNPAFLTRHPAKNKEEPMDSTEQVPGSGEMGQKGDF